MAASNESESSSIPKQLTHQIEDLSINTDDLLTIICANCGNEVINNPNTCNKCKAATIVMHPAKRKTDQSINRIAKNL